MLALRARQFLFIGLLVATGCGNTTTNTNCATNPAGCICLDDTWCGGANPRCNRGNGQCVPCLPTNDNCAQGSHCVNDGGYKCVATGVCATNSDCPKKNGAAVPLCCAGTCIDDVTKNTDNCGACNVKCPSPANGVAACVGGGCTIDSCNAGFANCDGNVGNGCETTTSGDIRNCGGCGKTCAVGGNATPVCTAGVCGATCVDGYTDCDRDPKNGCEVSTATDTKNCGQCGNICGVPPGSVSVVCTKGVCTAGACAGWFGDCDGNAGNGCETDTQSNAANCGGCGKVCPAVANGTSGCAVGTCGVAKCNAGFADCDNDPKNGCETKIGSDVNNCGACRNVCSGNNSQQNCVNGACTVAACNPGFSDCNMKVADGCEVNTLSDVLNCNGCGMACPVPANTIALCKLGVCGVGGCKPGFADCNKDPADGCEVDITSTSNCGACGVVCNVPANATAACRNGVCGIGMCNAGFGDCDQNIGNGCEKNLNTDNANCGVCGIACVPPMGGNIGNQCTMGKCVVGGCIPGFADCDNDKVSCEVNINSDGKNCGACGVVCPQNTPFCAGAKCTSSIHGTVAWPNAFNYSGNSCNMSGVNGVLIGNYQAVNLGSLPWKTCMIEASKRNAWATTPNYGSWPTPGWWSVRAPNSTQAMTGQWANYISADINTNQQCNVMREPQSISNGTFNSKGVLANTTVYDGNTWHYQDFGVMYIDQCTLLAGQWGASIITPWTIGLPNGDNYWQGILHTCSVYSWSAGNGTTFSYDNTIARASLKSCMLGWIDG